MKLQLTGYLILALIVSALGNAFLGWKWAGAKAQCRADMERAARIAIDKERDRAGKAEEQSAGISTTTAAASAAQARKATGDTYARDQAIRGVPTTGECRMPDGMPSIQPAIDQANSAAGI